MGKQHKDSLGWSLQKRGNTFFVYHRYSPDGKLVGKSTGQKDQEKAIQAALDIVANARLSLIPGSVMRGLLSGDIERDKTEQEEKLLGIELDKTNPRMSTLWTIRDKKEGIVESGILFELMKATHSHLSLVKFRCAWKFLVETLPQIHRVGEITPQHMEKVLKAKKENVNNVKKKPINELTLVQYWGIAYRTIFKTLIEQGWYHKANPAPVLKMSKQSEQAEDTKKPDLPPIFTDEQINAMFPIFESFDPAFLTFFKLALHTGMRRTEIANLRWEDVDLDNQPRPFLHVVAHRENKEKGIVRSTLKTKNSKRIIPLQTPLIEYLKPRRRATGYVVDSDKYIICREQFQLPKALVGKAKDVCRGFHMHRFRHTFITDALHKGRPLAMVARWAGDTMQMIEKTYLQTKLNDDIDF
jgi:site-specific recombinase XerD